MNYSPLGRAATEGSGAIRYSLRVPVWPADNVCIEELKSLEVGGVARAFIGQHEAEIEHRGEFFLFKILGLPNIPAAKSMWARLTASLVRLSASTGAALQFPCQLAEISRRDDLNVRFRECLIEEVYPASWTLRTDGTRTDGGIFPLDACILPEHERIWEYCLHFGRILRIASLSQLNEYLSSTERTTPPMADDNDIRMAAQALWLACGHGDRRIQFVLFVTALDILSTDEVVPNWAEPLSDVISEIQTTIASKSIACHAVAFQRLTSTIGAIGKPGMADRIRTLVLRSLELDDAEDGAAAQTIIAEMKGIFKRRAELAHGGKFLNLPSADECERLRSIVTAALERKLKDFGKTEA